VEFCGLNGPKPLENPFKVVGHEAPHHFEWVLDRFRAVETPKLDDFRPGSRPDLKTKQSHVQAYLTLKRGARAASLPARPPMWAGCGSLCGAAGRPAASQRGRRDAPPPLRLSGEAGAER